MQIIPDGPEIPESLLQSHEDGQVVFFCGAGISYNVGLGDFKWLVDKVYELNGTSPTSMENESYNKAQFDITLNILEERLPGQRQGMSMRRAIANALQPDFSRDGSLDTHLSLLQLGRTHDDALRLVTTNFDRAFYEAAKQNDLTFDSFTAPMLPIPKNSQWDGLVYLHGNLPSDTLNTSALDRLVVTSGDFGLAYLTERWAARFVSELLRNYTVCFVGYSLDDPVLRYMLDALAADRLRGEYTQSAYAIGAFKSDKRDEAYENWLSKGVIPILYLHDEGHTLLHETLQVWASSYRDGILGKYRVVREYAASDPMTSTKQDDFEGRMLWALSDRSGRPAKHFAEHNPVPPISWLETISEARFGHSDLDRYGVNPDTRFDENLKFSLIRRPAPYDRAPWMSIVMDGAQMSKWDDVMLHLARWLVRHMNDPTLVIWLVNHGGHLSPDFVSQIEHKLEKYEKLGLEGKTEELEKISKQSPKAIPDARMRTIWRMLINDRIKTTRNLTDLYIWKKRVIRDGLTASLRMELRRLLAPQISVRKSFLKEFTGDQNTESLSIERMFDCELDLKSENVHSVMINEATKSNGKWMSVLVQLLDEFQLLLHDALDLLHELDLADEHSDHSFKDLPSISPHKQNRRLGEKEWVTLIELLRISWLELSVINPNRADWIARKWFDLPYLTFKRLALFAAAQTDCIPPDVWTEWLLKEDAWWLWSMESQRETMRLLVLKSDRLPPNSRSRIETAILEGPPRGMFRDDIDSQTLEKVTKDSIWLLLAKFTVTEEDLGESARTILTTHLEQSDWKSVRDNERNEFPFWLSGSWDPDYEETRKVENVPRKWRDLVTWIKKETPQQSTLHQEDNSWRSTCRTRFYHCAYALCVLSREDVWPSKRWSEALRVWSEDDLVHRSWRYAGPLVQSMPNETLSYLAHDVAQWLQAISKSIDLSDVGFINVCSRVLDAPSTTSILNGDAVTQAINSPVGKVTQVLLDLWFKRNPNDKELIPEDLEPFFSRLCEPDSPKYIHGRVVLASRLIALYRIDQNWTETNLLPYFNWSANPNEAKSVWQGYLWPSRLYRPLLRAFKLDFLETSDHFAELNDYGRQYAQCLVLAALESNDEFQSQELRRAMAMLPPNGLIEASQALVYTLKDSGNNREQYWDNRLQPFWHQVWPKSNKLITSEIAESLAYLSIEARCRFAIALSEVKAWLQPIIHVGGIVSQLLKSGLCSRFPEESVDLLAITIDEQSYVTEELKHCLREVSLASPDLQKDSRYQKLDIILQKQGI